MRGDVTKVTKSWWGSRFDFFLNTVELVTKHLSFSLDLEGSLSLGKCTEMP